MFALWIGKRTLPQERTALDFWRRARNGHSGSAPSKVFWRKDCRLLRQALREVGPEIDALQKRALIVESNSLMQFVRPSLYFAVIDPAKEDFKESAQTALDRANALVLRGGVLEADAPPAPLWMKLPPKLLQERPSVLQREGEPLPHPIEALVHSNARRTSGHPFVRIVSTGSCSRASYSLTAF